MLKKSAFVKKEAPLYQRVCVESHCIKLEKRLSAVSQIPIIRASQFPPTLKLGEKGHMDILRGAPALSEFRVQKLLQRFAQIAAESEPERGVEIEGIYAEYVHFAELTSPLSPPERATLGQLLRYGPTIPEHTPSGTTSPRASITNWPKT
ncbi:phosphoribosylformylglycinamidine synthase, partial [Aeromonas enteropelogenes]